MFKSFFVALLCGVSVFCFGMWISSLGTPTQMWESPGWFAGLIFCAVWAGYTMTYNQKS